MEPVDAEVVFLPGMRGPTRRCWQQVGIVVVTLLTIGCASRGRSITTLTSPATTTTTTTTPARAPTTVLASPTTIGGTDDKAVYERLSNTATAELTIYTDSARFTDDPATLGTVDPELRFGSGLTPPTNPAIVNVAISTDAQWACLTGRSAAGHVFVMMAGPKVDVYAGATPLTVCSAAGSHGLRRVNG